MAHFAKVENGKVTRCVFVKNENCSGGEFPDSEESGQTFLANLGLDGEWLQTSYNKGFRGQFASVGMNWDGSIFYPDQPESGTTVNQSSGLWEYD